MSAFWIQVVEPGHSPRVVTVDDPVEVGRDCEGLLIEDPTASRRHLRLEPADFGLIVEDLSSANGTYIDDDRITEPMVVQAGNVVRLGETDLIVHEGHATEQRTGDAASSFGKDQRVSEESRKLVRAAQKLHRPGQVGRPPVERPDGR